ncbi:uncharacterized protein LOC110451792 [Mizuhopecten yessoensis]|uniref:Serine/threonine-protein kinase n=1 Tax=Mizuhopecten yessoensis TaxID=6573 RepID=A0A210QL52_MIZYE|nr:uncharacterized protein LOC110451792 [Mizuhopecten yessoensis]OWF49455.1 Serine/threonine-protein kinase [Mizuhopecten yessoensis]
MANLDSCKGVDSQSDSLDKQPSKSKKSSNGRRVLQRSDEIDQDVLQDDKRYGSVPDLVTMASSQQHTPTKLYLSKSNDDKLPDLVSPVNSPSDYFRGNDNSKEVAVQDSREKSGILKRTPSSQAPEFQQVPYYRNVSFQETENQRDDIPNEDEVKTRRRSYKDSGYGSDGSKNNSMGSQTQEGDVFDVEEHTLKVLQEKMNSNTNGEVLPNIGKVLPNIGKVLPNLSIMSSVTPTNSLPSPSSVESGSTVSGDTTKHNSEGENISQKQSSCTPPTNFSPKEGSNMPCLSMFGDEESEESIAGNIPLVSMLYCTQSRDDLKPSMNYVNKNGSMPSNVSASTGNDSSVCLPSDISGMSDPSFQTPSYRHVYKHYLSDGQPISNNMESQAPRTSEEADTLPISPLSMLLQMIQNDGSLLERCMEDPSDFLKMLDFYKQSSTPSPYQLNQERPHQHYEVISASDLEYISRCRDSSCSDPKCNKLREAVLGLTQALASRWSLECNTTIHQVGQALYHHAKGCGHHLYKCDVHMCHLLRSFTDGIEEVSQFLHCNSLPSLNLGQKFTGYLAKGGFIKLTPPGAANAVPNPDLILITTFGSFGNVALFTEEETQTDSKDRILKRIFKKDRGKDNLVEVYRKLSCEGHHHITPHMWVHDTADYLYVCTEFICGGTLEEYRDLHIFLQPDEATFIMQQLLNALTFLHEKQIIYLYWTASNMLFKDTSRRQVYLSNLSMSVIKTTSVDVKFHKSSLPACIVPPEIVTCDCDLALDERSDVWGAGCLYAEMLTGKQMWQDLRHSSREAVFKEMANGVSKMLCATKDTVPPHLRSLLTDHCWQHNVEDRITVAALQEKLAHLNQSTVSTLSSP